MLHILETDAASIIIIIQDPSRIRKLYKTIKVIYKRASRMVILILKWKSNVHWCKFNFLDEEQWFRGLAIW